jgi:hypothetical protein
VARPESDRRVFVLFELKEKAAPAENGLAYEGGHALEQGQGRTDRQVDG